MASQAVMKKYLTSVAKNNEDYKNNKTMQDLAIGIANFRDLAKEEQAELNATIVLAYEKLQSKGVLETKSTPKSATTPKAKKSDDEGLKGILADLKKKLGAERFKDATTGTDIRKDIEIPALKKGKRVVTTKGKTTNQYGTFKNQVGRPYWENRANRYDANQPSKTRKYKLADGGEVGKEIIRDKNKNDWKSKLDFYLKYNTTPINKGSLMQLAYESNRNIDTAIPREIWGELDNTFFYVYDYNEKSFGELVDLRDKLKFSNKEVAVTIVVNDEVIRNEELPEELQNATFHQALNYVFNHDEIQAFDIRPKSNEYAKGGEADDVEQNFKVGNIVELSESGWDNENYHDFFEGVDNVKLVITDVYTNQSEHQGFDKGVGMALYSTKRLDNNEEVPFDLYDYELEYVSKGKKYAEGGDVDAIKEGDIVMWKGNKYLYKGYMRPYTTSYVAGMDLKYHMLSPLKVGVDEAMLEDFKGVTKYAKGGDVRTLYKQFNEEKPTIALIMIADDVVSDFMRDKFDKTIDWSKLSDSEKIKYNEDYKVNKTLFEKYLMSEFVKLYYTNDSIKQKCKGSSRKTIDSIKSVMKSLAKEYPQDKYAKGGTIKNVEWVVNFIGDEGDAKGDYVTKYVQAKSEDEAINKGFMEISDDGEESDNYQLHSVYKLSKVKKHAQGGTLSSKAKYIPNRDIAEIEIERNGKSKSIDGANILDGVYVKKGIKFAKGGEVSDIDYNEILPILKEKLEDAVEILLPNEFENSSEYEGEEVENKSRDGFIAFTDGGYEVTWFEYVGYFNGSGHSLPTKALDDELQRQVDQNYEYAKERFMEEYPAIYEELGFDVDYNKLYEAGYESEAEQLSEWESDYDGEGTIACQVGAYYYSPDNSRGIEGKHTIRVFGLVNLESPYHRSGNLEDRIDIDITFDSIAEMEEKLDYEISEICSGWFNGASYNESTKELRIVRMAKGGEIKKSLAEFKKKIGAKKFREITKGVDIKADLKHDALKQGRRIVRKKGKTSNQYGTFKNKIGKVYTENRPNHYDANQPSERRKIKLADGGNVDKYNPEKTLSLVKVKFSNPKFNYTTNLSGDISEQEAKKYFVGQKFDVGVYPKENMQQVIDIDFYPKGTWSFDKEYAKGGKLSSKANYIPKRDIAEIEVEKNGKSKFIDGDNLLDGVYVRKGTKFAKGGDVKTPIKIKKQLESIRKSIQNENVSYAELAELQSLSKYIDPNDIELREWAGIPEFEDGEEFAKGGAISTNSKEVREAIKKHILENVLDENENEFKNIDEASQYVADEFKRVADYPYNLQKYPNNQKRFTDYLQGIPFGFYFYNDDIENFLNGLGINPSGKKYSSDKMWDLYGALIWKEVSPKYNKYAKGGGVDKSVSSVSVTYFPSKAEIVAFENYVYDVYSEDGFTKKQVKEAVAKYLDTLEPTSTKQFSWGYGDSLDRERVYQFLLDPKLNKIKNPTFAKGGTTRRIKRKNA